MATYEVHFQHSQDFEVINGAELDFHGSFAVFTQYEPNQLDANGWPCGERKLLVSYPGSIIRRIEQIEEV